MQITIIINISTNQTTREIRYVCINVDDILLTFMLIMKSGVSRHDRMTSNWSFTVKLFMVRHGKPSRTYPVHIHILNLPTPKDWSTRTHNHSSAEVRELTNKESTGVQELPTIQKVEYKNDPLPKEWSTKTNN